MGKLLGLTVGHLTVGRVGSPINWFANWFASASDDAHAHADRLRRLSFALWVGDHNQYVGALQGMLIESVVAGFKFGYADWRYSDDLRASVQVEALRCTRVLAVRVAAEHLTALWPVAIAELQRVLLAPLEARPALLLAACQLVDTLLTVLPDAFSPFEWMFVPSWTAPSWAAPSWAPVDCGSATRRLEHQAATSAAAPSTAPTTAPSPAFSSTSPPHVYASPSTLVPPAEFAALLEPLAQLTSPSTPPCHGGGLLRPSADGRRRPSLGMRTLSHASELAPFASNLHRHLAASAILPRCAEVDLPLLDVLLGCEFVAPSEAELMLAPHLLSTLEG
ncbi:hypothetical protein Ctob_007349 [Chrysochromulina tobinii]|uniref:DOP1-like C-terminal domain-containing protein n=1 Tax=Chrysochromulina tobinii TaxID=1460289 RepID=A0A0M0JDJ8_9EUKA|nr:hypothetical protein Ctob_007349 [Chrysochromulina tobinii]|eukprot:KOO24437.1 hypothetical protein Ctob_007349 [Chrysochromulina sp. CCMP291]